MYLAAKRVNVPEPRTHFPTHVQRRRSPVVARRSCQRGNLAHTLWREVWHPNLVGPADQKDVSQIGAIVSELALAAGLPCESPDRVNLDEKQVGHRVAELIRDRGHALRPRENLLPSCRSEAESIRQTTTTA